MKDLEYSLIDKIKDTRKRAKKTFEILRSIESNLRKGNSKIEIRIPKSMITIIDELCDLGFVYERIGEYQYIFAGKENDIHYMLTVE